MPVCEADAVGVAAFLKVMVWPFTFRVEPSEIKEPTLLELVVRAAVTVVFPEPVAVVRPSDFRRSAGPWTLRSAPVELRRLIWPPLIDEAVWLVLAANAATPAVMVALFTPLARSTALSTSATVAEVQVVLVPR